MTDKDKVDLGEIRSEIRDELTPDQDLTEWVVQACKIRLRLENDDDDHFVASDEQR